MIGTASISNSHSGIVGSKLRDNLKASAKWPESDLAKSENCLCLHDATQRRMSEEWSLASVGLLQLRHRVICHANLSRVRPASRGQSSQSESHRRYGRNRRDAGSG